MIFAQKQPLCLFLTRTSWWNLVSWRNMKNHIFTDIKLSLIPLWYFIKKFMWVVHNEGDWFEESLLSTVHNAYVADVPLQKDRWNFLVISLFKYNWDASGPTMRCKRVQKVQSSCGRGFSNYFSFPLFCITCLSEKYKYEIEGSAFYS